MSVLVDTSVWSLALRRQKAGHSAFQAIVVAELDNLILEGQVQIIGPIRQELLSGAKSAAALIKLRDHLREFEDLPLDSAVYERAAEMDFRCRQKGIHGTPTDLLICAAAIAADLSIFSVDSDFLSVQRLFPLRIHSVPGHP
ncbi:MAG: PIN domain-containing protein [Planctomycetes bacterium]|nr:PIN domain-containing protein [Planctomycetota bacterium]